MNTIHKKGFTLIEMIFVIVLLFILIAVAIAVYPTLLHNMKVRSDRASATNLARSIRAWYSDYSSDPKLRDTIPDLESNTVTLGSIPGIGKYLDPDSRPYSLLNSVGKIEDNQKFFAGIKGKGLNNKIIINIGTVGIEITDDLVVSYDGTSPGVVYIEP